MSRRRRPARVATARLSVLAFALAALGIGACCGSPWSAYPMAVPPDRSCRAGSPAGYDLYIWECREGQHTVVAKYSCKLSCHDPRQETAPCGELTPLERELGDLAGPTCRPVPEQLRWQTAGP